MTKDSCKNQKQITGAVLGAGFLLRFVYVLFSTIYERQYDIGLIDLDAGHTVTGGHLAYIQYLFHNWRLPDFDPTTVYQFHHPPLHHYVSALWLKLASFFIRDTAVLEESVQIVPFVCSLCILVVLLKILRQFALQEKTVQLLMLLFAFHPALVLLSGSVNNDCMSLLFTLLCVYTTIAWSRKPNARNIVKIGLSIALGMLTKQSVAQMAFPIGAVFLYVLWRRWKAYGLSGLTKETGQFILFGAVSIPLGMSFYLRNLILYQVPLLWVYELPVDSWQYTGNVPLLHRFLWPIPSDMVDNLLHFKLGCGYNVWMQLIRTSVLGEWDMAGVGRPVKLLAVLLMALGAVLAVAALAAFVWVFFLRPKKYPIDLAARIFFVTAYVVHLVFYLSFAYQYPQECSMHFRYIEIELLFPAVALGFVWQESQKKWLRYGTVAVLGMFAVVSAGMIGVWCRI